MPPSVLRHSALFLSAAGLAGAACAQQLAPAVQLETVVVTGRADSLLSVAASANEGVVGHEQLALRPLLRPGEIVEAIPGVIVSQHSGAGKANQYYLRGFNLDHGTDLLTSVDGVPINMRTHAHGQGYTDLNFLIPEFVNRVEFKKGPYYADIGDFGSAGAFNMQLFRVLPQNFVTLTGGTYGYGRLVLGDSRPLAGGNLLLGLELFHNDGPWVNPDDYQKINGLITYSRGTEEHGWSITGMAYRGDWTATDQLAQRAIESGLVDRFGTLDQSTGGESSRYSLQAEWHRFDDHSATKILLYGMYYDLDLFSNFTYFLDDPENGDQFEQQDRRVHWGATASHALLGDIFGKKTENTFGLQFRQDNIRNGLYRTALRNRLATTRSDRVIQSSIGGYYQNKTQWAPWFRTEAGVRVDYYYSDVNSSLPVNSGNQGAGIASPKLSLIFGPWAQTELYLNGGFGFHSNDGRGVLTRVDPVSGEFVTPADPLVRTKGAEFGVRTTALPGLQSSLALWILDIDSELLFIGDAGATEASLPSRRWGVESTNFYNPTPWLTLDADFAWSQARFTGSTPDGNRIPGSINTIVAAGLTVHDLPGKLAGWSASLRWRYFGPRYLTEDGRVQSEATSLVNAQIGYRFNQTWSARLDVFNVLDSKQSDIDYYYTSRLRGEPAAGVDDIHTHPAESRQIRLSVTANF